MDHALQTNSLPCPQIWDSTLDQDARITQGRVGSSQTTETTHHLSLGDQSQDASDKTSDKTSDHAASTNSPSSQSVPEKDVEKGDQQSDRITDWDGPDDPENAQNWPLWKKMMHTAIVSGYSLTTAYASSAITPGLPQADQEFHVGEEAGRVAFSIYVLGLACGVPLASPLSETMGRRLVYWTTFPVFALFVLGTGFANNIGALIVLRFLAGVFAAPPLSVGAATVADLFPPSQRSPPMALYMWTPFLGPALGPLIGGFVTTTEEWRWTSWTILFLCVAIMIPSAFQQETYKKHILQRRAKQRGVKGPPTPFDGKSVSATLMTFARTGITRPFHMFFTEPVVTSFALYVSFNFALLYSFFEAFPYVFETYYGFDAQQVGLTFLGIAVGSTVAAVLLVLYDRLYYQKLQRKAESAGNGPASGVTSHVIPEERLWLAIVGAPLISASLFLFAWTAHFRVHWIAPVIAEALFGCGNVLVVMCCVLYILDVYGPLYGASSQAAVTMLRYLAGAGFPLFSVQMFEGLGVGWAASLLGFVSLFGVAVVLGLFFFGDRVRSKSSYARGD